MLGLYSRHRTDLLSESCFVTVATASAGQFINHTILFLRVLETELYDGGTGRDCCHGGACFSSSNLAGLCLGRDQPFCFHVTIMFLCVEVRTNSRFLLWLRDEKGIRLDFLQTLFHKGLHLWTKVGLYTHQFVASSWLLPLSCITPVEGFVELLNTSHDIPINKIRDIITCS